MMYNKQLKLAVVLLCCFLIGFSCSKRDKETIKIGAVFPLTGDGAAYGQFAKMGIDLAVDEINGDPKRKQKVKVIYEDDKFDPKESTNAVSKLITVNKVPVILGPTASHCVRAVMPIATKNKVVIISPSATSHELSSPGGYFFRTVISDVLEAEVMAQFAYNDMKYRKIGILYIEAAGPFGMADAFEKKFKQLGGDIPIVEKTIANTTDLRTQITKLKYAHIDSIFFAGFAPETATLLKQAKELKIGKQILAHQTAEAPEVIQRAGAAANGVIFTSYSADPETSIKEVKEFLEKFQKKYGKEPQNFAANAYDATKLVMSAIDKYGYDSASIMKGLYEIKDYRGATGLITFNKSGDIIQPLRIMTIRNQKIVPSH